jgi:fructuronate reductase
MSLLSADLLQTLPSNVDRPTYDRRCVRTGIVHLGLGAFHRAHQAIYTDAALERGDMRWGTVGVELRRRHTVDLLAAQDHLYTVTERDGDTARTRLVGAVHGALFAPESLPALLRLIADPAVSIVSLTVTEKGYYRGADGRLDANAPEMRQDLATPGSPRTALGVIAAGLALRPADAPLTVLCCDNMPSNGDALRALLVDYTERFNGVLARRVRDDVGFPNSMVDRIVPAATPESRSCRHRLRTVFPVGRRGPVRGPASALGRSRRARDQRRSPLRDHEAAPAERIALGHRIPRATSRTAHGSRRNGRSRDRHVRRRRDDTGLARDHRRPARL